MTFKGLILSQSDIYASFSLKPSLQIAASFIKAEIMNMTYQKLPGALRVHKHAPKIQR
jgi:hypothetical protein